MNNAVKIKNDVTLNLPELVVPVMKQQENEEELSGNASLDEHIIGSKAPGIWLECNLDKDSVPTDKEDGELKPLYIDYTTINRWNLSFESFLPEMSFQISGEREYNAKVGNKVWCVLVPHNEDVGYDKIKLQFQISSINKAGDGVTYVCTYYVDNLFNSYPLYSNDKSSYDIAKEITKELQIGFKSNVDSIEDVAWYHSNKQMVDTLASLQYGTEMTDLFECFVDEDNYFNLVNLYNIKTNIEDDFKFIFDVSNENSDNNTNTSSIDETDCRLTNFKNVEMMPNYIHRYSRIKMSEGGNTGDNFIFRYIDVDEYGMPSMNNSQMEYENSDGKTVLITMGEQTKEDQSGKFVNKELLKNMKEKAYNKLFADMLEVECKYIYGLKRYQQILVDIWQYDGVKKTQASEDDELKEDEESNPDTTPTKDPTLSGQYLILKIEIFYEKTKGDIRARYRLFKLL